MALRRLRTDELRPHEVAALRDLFDDAWGRGAEAFTADDWDHAVGGLHVVLEMDGSIVAHASVVERELHASGHRLATGYVEAVAALPAHQRRGYGTAVMREAGRYIDETFELGALGGTREFYERLGWVVWRGPTFVRTEQGLTRTADDDGSVLVRLTSQTPELDLSAPISCDWRPGDVW